MAGIFRIVFLIFSETEYGAGKNLSGQIRFCIFASIFYRGKTIYTVKVSYYKGKRAVETLFGNDMRNIRWVLCFCFGLLFVQGQAQTDARYSQYWALPGYYNAGAAGSGDRLNLLAATSQQWVGMPGAPSSFFVSADMPFRFLKQNHGVGIIIDNGKEGLYSNILLGVQYAFKVKLWQGYLGLGVQLGMVDQKWDGTKVDLSGVEGDDYHQSTDDAIPTTELEGTAFDMAFGIYYTHKYFWVGLSATHLTEPTISFEEKYETYVPRLYYFMAGGNIPIKNTLFELQPSLMLRTDFLFTQFELSMRVKYNRLFWGGLGYRLNDALIVMIGAEYKNFFAGYAYDYPLSAVVKVSSGGHEVFLGYRMKLNFSAKNKNKHRSIRIM